MHFVQTIYIYLKPHRSKVLFELLTKVFCTASFANWQNMLPAMSHAAATMHCHLIHYTCCC